MSNEPRSGKGIDPELLAAYIDQRLSPEQRAAVEAELVSDPDSYELLVETMKAVDDPSVSRLVVNPAPPKPIGRWRWTVAGGALAAAATIALIVWTQLEFGRLGNQKVAPRFERLVAAVGSERYVEARLTGGFPHASLREVMRGGSDDNLSLLGVAGEFQKAAHENPTAETLHALGVAQLLLGRLDDAINTLTSADEAANSLDRRILSDLAAAHVTRATRSNRADDWPIALAAASKAVEGSSERFPEALFNRALAAEALNLRAVAEEYWREYAAVETDVAWRSEAETHLRRLREGNPQSWKTRKPEVDESAARGAESELSAAVTQHSLRIRESVEDEWLPLWARQEMAGESTAPHTLVIAERLAAALASRTTDDLLARTIRIARDADPADRIAMAKGVVEYARGRELYERAAMQASIEPFARAKKHLEPLSVPLAEWCDLYLATASYYGGSYQPALKVLDDISRRTSGETWLALTARIEWLRGLIATQRAEFDRALSHYTTTLAHFERLLELENQAAVHSLIATALLYLGDKESVWYHTVRSLQNRTMDTPYRRHHMILAGATNRAIRLGLPDSALVLADEAAAVNKVWGDAVASIEVANYRARTLVLLDRTEEAKAEVDSAHRSLVRVQDEALRRRAEAELMQTEADVLAALDPIAGIDAATRAIAFFEGNRSALRLPRLYVTRASARRRLGDVAGAITDLEQGAAKFDLERKTLPRSERLRLAYSDEVWDAYRQLVSAEVDRGAGCESLLAAADRARATTLVTAPDEPFDRAAVPAGHAVVSFSFIGERLLIIVLRAAECHLRIANLTPATAEDMVRSLRTALSLSQPLQDAARTSSAALFTQIFGPIWPLLTDTVSLDVIADGPLHYLPFSALRMPDGRYLIEATAIRMLPSLRETRPTSPGKGVDALVSSGASQPAIDLPLLPGAADEAAAVGDSLRSAGFPVHQSTEANSFLQHLRSSHVVHFAGHAVVNAEYPLLSRLIFGGTTPWITAEQIIAAGPIRSRLVFLSACSTQAGRVFGGEGPASFARSFLAAGAHEVVATLWPIPDANTKTLVTTFYQFWLQTGDAAAALRSTILTELRTAASGPTQWAAWTVVGRAGARQSRSDRDNGSSNED